MVLEPCFRIRPLSPSTTIAARSKSLVATVPANPHASPWRTTPPVSPPRRIALVPFSDTPTQEHGDRFQPIPGRRPSKPHCHPVTYVSAIDIIQRENLGVSAPRHRRDPPPHTRSTTIYRTNPVPFSDTRPRKLRFLRICLCPQAGNSPLQTRTLARLSNCTYS